MPYCTSCDRQIPWTGLCAPCSEVGAGPDLAAPRITQEDVDNLAASIERPPGEKAVVGEPCPCCGRKV